MGIRGKPVPVLDYRYVDAAGTFGVSEHLPKTEYEMDLNSMQGHREKGIVAFPALGRIVEEMDHEDQHALGLGFA